MTNEIECCIIKVDAAGLCGKFKKDVITVASYNSAKCAKSARIERLKEELFRQMPQIEADRALLLTQSYMATEGEPIVTRRAKAFKNILENIPVTIRPDELIVGSATVAPRSCQVFPEFSFSWLEDES